MRTFILKEHTIQLFRHIIYLNIVVSLSTGVLSAGLAHLLGYQFLSLYFGLFAFFSTFTVYNGQRLFKITEAKTNWMYWVRDNKKPITVATIVSALAALAVFLRIVWGHMNEEVAVIIGASGLISAFYVVRIKGKNLREVPFIKIHLISLTWVLILVLFPFLQLRNSNPNWGVVFLICLAHYCYVLAITIPFDIRDLKYDKSFQRTIPQLFGVRTAKLVSVGLLLFFMVVLVGVGVPIASNALFYIAVFTQIALTLWMKPDRSDLYCAGGIDGAVALLGLAYLFY